MGVSGFGSETGPVRLSVAESGWPGQAHPARAAAAAALADDRPRITGSVSSGTVLTRSNIT
ncbi:hypothetical protein [Arthrobacter sp. 92]|uniref:hypothetical protein n=1 Tax=Arthrobacter sp. 92 TaxID=3418175 RepID=UPI003CFE1FC6